MHIKAARPAAPRMGRMLVESGTLAEHHRRCSALFAEARQAARAAPAAQLSARVGALRDALLTHFGYEEAHVFPLYEQADGVEGSAERLRAQHDDMRALLWALGTASPAGERSRYEADLAELQALFDGHAAEEEARLYPILERLLARG
jgi:hypothetical protein